MNLRKWIYCRPEEDNGSANGGAPDTAASDDAADWASLNADVLPGSDDEDDGASETPGSEASENPTDETDAADGSEDSTTDEDPVDPNPSEDAPPVVLDEQQTLTPEQLAEQEKKIAEDFAKWEQAQVAQLEEMYAFDEDTAQRLQTEPELVLPKIAAKLHMEVMKNAVTTIQRMLPSMVPPILESQNVEKTATDLFYGINPDLKKYHNQVLQAGKMFRKLNPKASPEEAAEKIGNIVRNSLGLKAPEGKKPAATRTPARPASKPAPHRPAAAGSGSAARPAAKTEGGNFWADLVNDDD